MSYRSKKVKVKKEYNSVCRSLVGIPFLAHYASRIGENENLQSSSYYQYSRGPVKGWVIVKSNRPYSTSLEIRADFKEQIKKIYGELEKKIR